MSLINFVVGADKSPFTAVMRSLSPEVRNAARTMSSELAESTRDGMRGVANNLAAGLGAGAVLGKLNEVADSAIRINAVAKQTGFSTDFVQGWRGIAEDAGETADAADTVLEKFNRIRGQAMTGDATALAAFRDVGVSLADVNDKSVKTEQLFLNVADALAKVADASERAALGSAFTGKTGGAFTDAMAGGSGGILAGISDEVKMSTAAIEALIAAKKQLNDFSDSGTVVLGESVGFITRGFEKLFTVMSRLPESPAWTMMLGIPSTGGAFGPRRSLFDNTDDQGYTAEERENQGFWAKINKDKLAERERARRDADIASKGAAAMAEVEAAAGPDGLMNALRSRVSNLTANMMTAETEKEREDYKAKLIAVTKELANQEKQLRAKREAADEKNAEILRNREERALYGSIEAEEALAKEKREEAERVRRRADEDRRIADELASLDKRIAEKKRASVSIGTTDDVAMTMFDASLRSAASGDAQRSAEELAEMEAQRAKILDEQNRLAVARASEDEDRARQESALRQKAEFHARRLDERAAWITEESDPEKRRALIQGYDSELAKLRGIDPTGRYATLSDDARNVGASFLRGEGSDRAITVLEKIATDIGEVAKATRG